MISLVFRNPTCVRGKDKELWGTRMGDLHVWVIESTQSFEIIVHEIGVSISRADDARWQPVYEASSLRRRQLGN